MCCRMARFTWTSTVGLIGPRTLARGTRNVQRKCHWRVHRPHVCTHFHRCTCVQKTNRPVGMAFAVQNVWTSESKACGVNPPPKNKPPGPFFGSVGETPKGGLIFWGGPFFGFLVKIFKNFQFVWAFFKFSLPAPSAPVKIWSFLGGLFFLHFCSKSQGGAYFQGGPFFGGLIFGRGFRAKATTLRGVFRILR